MVQLETNNLLSQMERQWCKDRRLREWDSLIESAKDHNKTKILIIKLSSKELAAWNRLESHLL